MKLKTVALIGALSMVPSLSSAQSLATDAMKTGAQEEQTIRLSGTSEKVLKTYGFVDLFRKEDKNAGYGELQLRRDFGSHGVQAELNAGTGMKPVWRAGYIRDIAKDSKDRFYINAKILPITFSKDRRINEAQVGTFGYVRLPKGFYVENWTDYTTSEGKRSSISTEFTAGKKVVGNLSAQGQAAYNVNSPGWAFRAGGRYKLF